MKFSWWMCRSSTEDAVARLCPSASWRDRLDHPVRSAGCGGTRQHSRPQDQSHIFPRSLFSLRSLHSTTFFSIVFADTQQHSLWPAATVCKAILTAYTTSPSVSQDIYLHLCPPNIYNYFLSLLPNQLIYTTSWSAATASMTRKNVVY